MSAIVHDQEALPLEALEFYRHVIRSLKAAELPFLLGGAYAFGHYTGITRHTRDLDVFVRPEDAQRVLDHLGETASRTELTFPHWLGKIHQGDDYCDVIFSSGNGVARVDERWFEHSAEGTVFGETVRLIPPEEMIWSKAYICERERYDGADVLHLIRALGPHLDWERLLERFGAHWRVLLSHLVLFGFVYPAEQDSIPAPVLEELLQRMTDERIEPPTTERFCQGTLLSRMQYLKDIEEWGYADGRRFPEKFMSKRDIRHWTEAGRQQQK